MSARLLTVADVAELLRCGRRKAREVMLALPHVRVGKLLRIRPAVLERWTEAGGDEYEPERLTRVRSARVASLPRVPSGALRVPVAKRKAAS